MANAKKCDLCEKYYEPYGCEPDHRSWAVDTVEPNSIDLVYSIYDYPEDHNDIYRPVAFVRDHFDLCPECLGKISEFIESLKKEINK